MVKRIALAILWSLAAWMWIAIAHVFLGTPDLSLLGGLVALAVVAALTSRTTERQITVHRGMSLKGTLRS